MWYCSGPFCPAQWFGRHTCSATIPSRMKGSSPLSRMCEAGFCILGVTRWCPASQHPDSNRGSTDYIHRGSEFLDNLFELRDSVHQKRKLPRRPPNDYNFGSILPQMAFSSPLGVADPLRAIDESPPSSTRTETWGVPLPHLLCCRGQPAAVTSQVELVSLVEWHYWLRAEPRGSR